MPNKRVAIRYIGERQVDGLFPGYRYEMTREDEARLFAKHGNDIVRLEPDPDELPILTIEEEKPKKRTRRKKVEADDGTE